MVQQIRSQLAVNRDFAGSGGTKVVRLDPLEPGAEATAFLARTSGLDAVHTNAYIVLINGLVADGVWSKFDGLYMFATQDSATAALSLISSTYNATVNGSPTFTADKGFTGANNTSTSNYLSLNFNPTSASSPKYVRDSAHLALYNLANVTSNAYAIGCDNGSLYAGMAPGISAQFLCPLNDATGNGVANSDSRGHYIGNRSASNAKQGYKNGVSVWSAAPASTGLPNQTFFTTGENSAGTPFGAPYQLASASFGSSLSSTDALNYCTRVATFLEAVRNPCAEAIAFLVRTSGLDEIHRLAYIDLINGLVADGVWTKLDAFWMFATQDSATALLNLVSATYNAVSHGSPTFTADRGFTGTNASTTIYLDSTFTPSTAVSPKFTQNSGHLSVWALNNITSGFPAIGTINSGTPNETDIYVKFTDNNSYYRINGAGATGFADATSIGDHLGTRASSGGGVDGYKNGSSVGNTSGASQALSPRPIYILANNLDGTANGSAHQIATASIGSNLTSTDVTNFYNRRRTFLTAVGVP